MPRVLASGDTGEHFVDVTVHWWHWAVLLVVIVSLLLFDLLVLHREAKVLGPRRAALESIVWIACGLGFGLVILAWFGGAATGEYISGYLSRRASASTTCLSGR